MKKSASVLLSVLIALLVALFILSVSIALPILIRPLYYLQINSLELPEYMESLSYDQIKTCYDEMLDYCLGLRSEFSVGGLRFSEEGVSHFDDVRTLFFIDFAVAGISAFLLAVLAVVLRLTKIKPCKILGRSAPFWSVASIGTASSLIALACAIDFDTTFDIFHKIFFVGKTNWAFDPYTDPIILLLPHQFFISCAIMIFASVLIFSAAILLYEFLPRRKLIND